MRRPRGWPRLHSQHVATESGCQHRGRCRVARARVLATRSNAGGDIARGRRPGHFGGRNNVGDAAASVTRRRVWAVGSSAVRASHPIAIAACVLLASACSRDAVSLTASDPRMERRSSGFSPDAPLLPGESPGSTRGEPRPSRGRAGRSEPSTSPSPRSRAALSPPRARPPSHRRCRGRTWRA